MKEKIEIIDTLLASILTSGDSTMNMAEARKLLREVYDEVVKENG